MYDVVASIVTYHTPIEMLDEAIRSFMATNLKVTVVLVDNSQSSEIEKYAEVNNLIYIDSGRNIGFGGGHNKAIFDERIECKYFVILNPDTKTLPNSLEKLFSFMEKYQEVALSAPLILNPDGSIQYVHKKLPGITIAFVRRFTPEIFKRFFQKTFDSYELRDLVFDRPISVPSLSGCFLFFRTQCLRELKGFDECYFLYMEDVDICRRAKELGSVILFPDAKIIHLWKRGSYNSLKLTMHHSFSQIKYFLKWGLRKDNRINYLPEGEL